jgi:hypothetical protein
MATNYTFTNVEADKATIGPKLLKLKQRWDEYIPLWNKAPRAKKIQLYKAGKLPLIGFMIDICKYVKKNFPDIWELIDD